MASTNAGGSGSSISSPPALVGVVSLPAQVVVAILVRNKLGSPVFFRHERPGLNGEPFILVKFRTMTDETDADGNLLPDDVRLTRFGQLLRSNESGRASRTLERGQGRHEPGGPPPAADEVPAAVHL